MKPGFGGRKLKRGIGVTVAPDELSRMGSHPGLTRKHARQEKQTRNPETNPPMTSHHGFSNCQVNFRNVKCRAEFKRH